MTGFRQNVDQWIDILNKLDFERRPVAVKFLTRQPEGIDKLEKTVFFCEMLRIAQEGKAFYADSTNHMCDAGLYLTGGKDVYPRIPMGNMARAWRCSMRRVLLEEYTNSFPS